MLWEIIRKEILENIKSPKFIITFLICIVLIILSVYTGANNYMIQKNEYEAGLKMNKENLEEMKSYVSLQSHGMKLVKPPETLSSIVTGICEAFGRRTTVSYWGNPEMVDSKYESNPISAIFKSLDLLLIVKIVLSLFTILFTYDLISGEKERGTLRLTLSNCIPRYILILGKFIGSFISLMIPLVIPLIMVLIIFVLFPGISFSGEDWIRMTLIFILFLLYLFVFFSLGLFISAFTKNSSNSLLILLFMWIMFIFIIPKTSVMIAKQIFPTPSVFEITARKDEVTVRTGLNIRKKLEETRGDRKKMNGEEWQAFLGKITQERNDMAEKGYAEINEDFHLKHRKQEKLAENLSRVSPASLLTFASLNLAKTGIRHHERFINAVRNYNSVYIKWVNDKNTQDRITYFANRKPSPKPDFSDMPQFVYNSESLSSSLTRAIPDIALVIFMIILFSTCAFVSFLRYDAR